MNATVHYTQRRWATGNVSADDRARYAQNALNHLANPSEREWVAIAQVEATLAVQARLAELVAALKVVRAERER